MAQPQLASTDEVAIGNWLLLGGFLGNHLVLSPNHRLPALRTRLVFPKNPVITCSPDIHHFCSGPILGLQPSPPQEAHRTGFLISQ